MPVGKAGAAVDADIVDQVDRPKLALDRAITGPNDPVAKIDGIAQLIPGGEWSTDLQRRLKSVQREIVLAVSDPIRMERRYPTAELLVRDMLTVGKRVRILVSPKYADSRGERALRAGCPLIDRIRVTYTDFHNAMIVDRREAVVWASADGAPRAYLFTGKVLPGSIGKFVTRAWSVGLPLRNHMELRRKDFDSTAITVMRYLNAGVTDEVAARQLSVSPRTYRRHVADIMARLDTTTRFQLGARAVELGLLH
ncbi:regulatory LuxR family protein [Nocardia ignorata]|uniref:Regulatory LuxR family protein n=1 Tax=Nocardia ignorata TaxID=145285 RepID=A0A4R6PJ80_NOCIG|nr:regulatory LuxR family protein [Nocardia ignorata]